MTSPSAFARRVRECWSSATAMTYTPGNPARGQCSVTALVAQDWLGGAIVKTDVAGAWHFYNLIDGDRFDFTHEQFTAPLSYSDSPSSREEAFTNTTPAQYAALFHAIRLAAQKERAL